MSFQRAVREAEPWIIFGTILSGGLLGFMIFRDDLAKLLTPKPPPPAPSNYDRGRALARQVLAGTSADPARREGGSL